MSQEILDSYNSLVYDFYHGSNKMWCNVAVAGHSAIAFLSCVAGFISTEFLISNSNIAPHFVAANMIPAQQVIADSKYPQ